jgi:hypothetical protein
VTRLTPLALCFVALSAVSVRAQPNDIAIQQANLQALLDNAITAIRNNDNATACQLRSQALGILGPNLNAFMAAYPGNNWPDLQTSLQDSLSTCQAKGL